MKKLIILLSSLLFSIAITAQENCLLDQEPVQELVQDYAGVLTPSQEEALKQSLIAFNDTTSTQILIVTVNDLCGYDKAEFTYTLGEKWGVGQKGKDNGVVIMVKPHGKTGDRHAFIAPGYGLEGVLPDATAKKIVEYEMIPFFKQEKFYEGIEAAATIVMKITSGEFSADEYSKTSIKSFLPILFGLIVFIIIIAVQARRTRQYANDNGLTFWAAWSLMNAAGRSHGGSWGNFNSGGGSFGGFGGGSFGGGGAGGSW